MGRSLRLVHVDGNLSPSQREVLFTITRRGPVRLSEVAASEGINPTMLSRIVSHLESANLVIRTPDTSDARVMHLSCTDQGRALCKEIRNERTDVLHSALSQLTVEQRQMLLDALPVLESLVKTLNGHDQ
jgi:DNA-binding MarR family transcriptional regulator